jgi:hypothetical protein
MVETTTERTIINVTNNDGAPFIFFDAIGAYGAMEGAILLELVAHTLVPTGPTTTKGDLVTTAHLRCSPAAAVRLQEMIGRALDTYRASQGRTGPAN